MNTPEIEPGTIVYSAGARKAEYVCAAGAKHVVRPFFLLTDFAETQSEEVADNLELWDRVFKDAREVYADGLKAWPESPAVPPAFRSMLH